MDERKHVVVALVAGLIRATGRAAMPVLAQVWLERVRRESDGT